MVGCVIVHNNVIIGEGWHQHYGEAHAEVNAINNVRDKALLKEATIYVSLEPCSIFGNTPPCADLIIRHGIPKVVIATLDDHPEVSGNGVKRLREHGIEVITGVCEHESRELNKYFISNKTKQRPYVLLKWAESYDGYIAPPKGQFWLSNDYTRRLTHKWRMEMDAILVGRKTAEEDDPKLTDRYWEGKNPLRVVLDPQLRLSKNKHLLADEQPSLIINGLRSAQKDNKEYLKMTTPFKPASILQALHQRRIMSVLIEGGAYTLNAFIQSQLFDEIVVYRSQKIMKEGIKAPDVTHLQPCTINFANDQLNIYRTT